MRAIIIIMGFLLFSCDNPIEFQMPVTKSLDKGIAQSVFHKYSYLIVATPDTFTTYFDIVYYLHRDQNIAVGIYTNPPIELRQVVVANEFQLKGVHRLRIYVESQIETGKYHWVKLIMEDRDFYTYIFRSE